MSVPSFWRRHEVSLLLAILCVVIVTAVLDAQHNYVTDPANSAWQLLRQWSMLSLFALGAAVVIITGGIDLSTGSVIALSGTVCATIMLLLAPEALTTPNAPMPMWVAVSAIGGTIFVGFLIGSLHAWLITVVGLPPFVATLATLVGLRSLARALCESVTLAVNGGVGTQINVANQQFRYLANSVWIPAVLVIVLSLALWIMLSRSVLGRHLYALGGNEQAARLSGIRTDHLKWVAYCLSAILSSLSGILYVCDQTVAEPQTLGRGYELNAIAASVVGGCSLQGGVGTVPGTLLGALFLRVVIDGVAKIIDTGADVFEGLIVGVVVVFAVTFSHSSTAVSQRRGLFAGGLGWVTILNLTILAGVLMALLGFKFTQGRLNMDALWLSSLAMISTVVLLLLARQEWSSTARRRTGIAWAVGTIVLVVGLDRAYPGIQTNAAMAAIKRAGGQVVQNDTGIVVDLSKSTVDDDTFRRLTTSLEHLRPLGELRLTDTDVTDRTLRLLPKFKSLKAVDLHGTKVTPGGVVGLRRALSATTVTE